MNPSVYILYHFFYPDNVVSAEHKRELAQGLAEHGWNVTVITSNRFRHDPEKEIALRDEDLGGMRVIRVSRRPCDQSKVVGRLRNSFSMQRAWLAALKLLPEPDVLILGTDPQFSQLMFPFLRKRMRRTKLALWGFDIYPEILEASESRCFALCAKALRPLMQWAYRPVDLLADIGPCMQKRLSGYARGSKRETLVPWALIERDALGTPDERIRSELFGSARLGILYSGTIGQAHAFENFIALARRLRLSGASVAFCFAGHGTRYAEMRAMASPEDTNIRFSGFCPREELEQRLIAADLHMISLRSGWEGTVVPSKFFGALAVGKPVLYDGSPESDIGIWVNRMDLGILLTESNIDVVARRLTGLADDRASLTMWQMNALDIYKQHFAREKVIEHWNQVLRDMISSPSPATDAH